DRLASAADSRNVLAARPGVRWARASGSTRPAVRAVRTCSAHALSARDTARALARAVFAAPTRSAVTSRDGAAVAGPGSTRTAIAVVTARAYATVLGPTRMRTVMLSPPQKHRRRPRSMADVDRCEYRTAKRRMDAICNM